MTLPNRTARVVLVLALFLLSTVCSCGGALRRNNAMGAVTASNEAKAAEEEPEAEPAADVETRGYDWRGAPRRSSSFDRP